MSRRRSPYWTPWRAGQHIERRLSLLDKVDGVFFTIAGVSAIWLGYLVLREGVHTGWRLLLLVVFWVLFTYLLLPRLHRILTRVYVPEYFIGRARTSDGLLGDPVNLALLSSEAQIHAAMVAAGWTRADDLSLRTGSAIVSSTLRRRSYSRAPVSPLLLFDRQQDFAYQQEVAGSPSKRHHVRFWRCPDGWMLPGGYAVDWLAAGTYDRSVGLSLFTLQITHKIEQNTDVERDFITSTLSAANPEARVRVIDNFSSGYHSRNGGGDLIQTDGDLPIVDLSGLAVAPLTPIEQTDSRDRRPPQIVFGGGVAVLQGLVYLLLGALAVLAPTLFLEFVPDAAESDLNVASDTIVRTVFAVGFVLAGLVDVGLGVAVLAGRAWARLLSMASSVVAIGSAFVLSLTGSEEITLTSNLPGITLSILVLLSLSSHSAREYTAWQRGLAKARRASIDAA